MPRGASPKREREYRKLKHAFEKEGRYRGREEEVASRVVNKQRAQYGETQAAKAKARDGRSPDKNLPIAHYQQRTVPELTKKLDDLSTQQLRRIKTYEKNHKARVTLLKQIERHLH